MNKVVVYGSIICLVALGGLFYWFMQTSPSADEISAQVTKIDKVNSNLLTSNGAKSVKSYTKNGNIPVVAQTGTVKTNPFQ